MLELFKRNKERNNSRTNPKEALAATSLDALQTPQAQTLQVEGVREKAKTLESVLQVLDNVKRVVEQQFGDESKDCEKYLEQITLGDKTVSLSASRFYGTIWGVTIPLGDSKQLIMRSMYDNDAGPGQLLEVKREDGSTELSLSYDEGRWVHPEEIKATGRDSIAQTIKDADSYFKEGMPILSDVSARGRSEVLERVLLPRPKSEES